MVSLRFISLVALVAASPLESDLYRRDGASVAADLKNVHEKLKDMTKAMDTFTGGILQGATLLPPQAALEGAFKKATTNVKNEPATVPEDQARLVIDAVKTLMPDVKAQMDVVEKKKDAFGLIKTIVVGEMNKMRGLSRQLQDEVVKRAPASMKDEAQALEDQINKEWARGLTSVGAAPAA